MKILLLSLILSSLLFLYDSFQYKNSVVSFHEHNMSTVNHKFNQQGKLLKISRKLKSKKEKKNDDDDDKSDYDKYGCCLSCGEFYCPKSKKCVSDWDDCNLGHYDSSTNKCQYFYDNSKYSFSYELGSYAVPRANFYEITDEVSHPNEEYRYYFNLCKHVETKNLPKVCATTLGSASESCSGKSLAFQYVSSKHQESCYRMSDCNRVYNTDKIELGLLDSVEPASGLYIQYYGGNSCPNSYTDKAVCDDVITKNGRNETYCSRSFRLNIKCHDEITTIPLKEKVEEAGGCLFEATINHRMGCPVECPRNPQTDRVCSGRGLCFYSGYDKNVAVNLKKSKGLGCVCKKGYTGDACESYSLIVTISAESGIPIWFVVFTLFILISSVVLLAVRHRDKFQSILSGDLASAFPTFFGRRIAHDGKGFYSRVGDSSYNPYAATKSSSSGKNIQMAGNDNSAEESFTL